MNTSGSGRLARKLSQKDCHVSFVNFGNPDTHTAVFDAVDLAIGRGAGVDRAGAIYREGENLGLRCGPQQGALGRAFDFVQAAAVSGGGVDGAIGGLGEGPDDGLIAAEEGLDLGREGKAAFAAQREAVEASTNEIGIRVEFPGGSAAGKD